MDTVTFSFPAGNSLLHHGSVVPLWEAGVCVLSGGVSGPQLGEPPLLLQGMQVLGHLQRNDSEDDSQ
uniref:Uncharacterized protein n=2 Tax=Anguilla anguilla TaxID=7936 RepID=A0A0E9QNF2_ANGAN